MQPDARGTGSVLAVGEILWDLLPAGPRLGGTTANFAIGCARLGRQASLISSLGADAWGDRAREILTDLQQGGAALLNTALIQTAANTPTGLVEVVVDAGGQPSYAIAMPAAWDEIHLTPASLAAATTAAAICFGTLCQRSPVSRASIRSLLEAVPPGCLRVLDVNVRAPFFSPEVARWSLAHATVAKISAEELGEVAAAVGVPPIVLQDQEPRLAEVEQCGRQILALHPEMQLLAVTMGPHGSLLLTPVEVHYHPGFLIEVIDTVGAGDAYTAGLVHAWLAGASLSAVNEVGNLCGSFVASHPGATPVFSQTLLERVGAALHEGSA